MRRAGRTTLRVQGGDWTGAAASEARSIRRAFSGANAKPNGLDPAVLVHGARGAMVENGEPLVVGGGVAELADTALVPMAPSASALSRRACLLAASRTHVMPH